MGSLVKLRRSARARKRLGPGQSQGPEFPQALLYMAIGVVGGLLLALAVVIVARGNF